MKKKITIKKQKNKTKLYKGIGVSILSGALLIVPATTIGLTTKNFTTSSNDNINGNKPDVTPPTDNGDNNQSPKPPIDTDKPVVPKPEEPKKEIQIQNNVTLNTTFDDILKGFGADTDLTTAVNQIVNKEDNKKKIINNYEEFGEQKQNINISIANINQGNEDWGTIKYNIWKESSTIDASINNLEEFIHIFSLDNLKKQLNEEKLKTLLKAASIDSTNFTGVKIVDNTDIGIEKNVAKSSNIAKDLIHINVEANDQTRALKKYDLGIPISNIKYDLNNIELTASLNSNTNTKNTNINIDFGIDSTIEKTINKHMVIDSQTKQKDTVEVGELISQLGWNKTEEPHSRMTINLGKTIELDSNKIGKELGIYNVTFSNPVDSTPQDKKIGMDEYDGMSLTLDAKPKENFKWEDGTDGVKKITISNLNVEIKDSRVQPWCRIEWDSRYGIVWKEMYPENNVQFPKNIDEFKKILQNEETFNNFWKIVMNVNEYKNDFRSIKMELVPTSITVKKDSGENSVYWFETNFKPLKGHILIDKIETGNTGKGTLPLGQKLYFQVRLNR